MIADYVLHLVLGFLLQHGQSVIRGLDACLGKQTRKVLPVARGHDDVVVLLKHQRAPDQLGLVLAMVLIEDYETVGFKGQS